MCLKLAYDDYYPNRQIAEKIKNALNEVNIRTVLVQDSYENPTAIYDLKLMITRGIGDHEYIKYASFFFHRILRTQPDVWNLYRIWFKKLEQSEVQEQDHSIYRQLQKVLDDNAVAIPFARVPSCYFSSLEGAYNPAYHAIKRDKII